MPKAAFIRPCLLAVSILCSVTTVASPPDREAQALKKIQALTKSLTVTEKLELLGGTGFGSKPVARLGIPSIDMIDGPQGIRGPRATAFPGALTMVATWNPELIRSVGAAIGREVRAFGKNMILGPCVSLYRVPQSGRNYECFGEDPHLNALMAGAYVRGVHDSHVMTSTKHFLLNAQEINRKDIDMHIDERALHELELPAFKAAIDEKTESIMSSYNLVDGLHASESSWLHGLLKKYLGFKGFIVSDWESTYNGLNAALAGLDLEMPYGSNMGPQLLPDIESGRLPMSVIDEKIQRLLSAIYLGAAKDAPSVKPELNSRENRQAALRAAEEAIVLLKNDGGLLPLKRDLRSIALIGPGAAYLRHHGGGSGQVTPKYNVSILEALKSALPKATKVNYARGVRPGEQVELFGRMTDALEGGMIDGFKAEYFDNADLKGKPVIVRREPNIQIWNTVTPDPRLEFDKYSARWTGRFRTKVAGAVRFDFGVTGKRYRFTVDGIVLKDVLYNEDGWENYVDVDVLAEGEHTIQIEYRNEAGNFYFGFGWIPPEPWFADAIRAAKESDVAILVVGTSSSYESEANDRSDLIMPGDQDKLINEVMKVNPNTIVVVHSGGPVSMRAWRDRAPAILQAWFPGQEGGRAIARILTGAVNPSGKLPITLPRELADSPSAAYYKGQSDRIDYSLTSILEGYRDYDAKRVEPEFAFGHGLSYTRFTYGTPVVRSARLSAGAPKVVVTMKLTNSGAVAGAEAVQLYVEQQNPVVVRAPRELRGFEKVFLKPGESRELRFTLDASAFRYWDTARRDWVVPSGKYTIHLGSSSRDLRTKTDVELGQ